MKHSRLSRPFHLTLLAIAGLLALSYVPLTKTRAANAGGTILPSVGKPLVNLKSPQTPKLTYTGDAGAVAALQGGTAAATALASADFNTDGAPDVVAGYSTANGGVLVLYKGNPDAFAPADTTLFQKAMKGNVPPTFQPQAVAFSLNESPDLLATGDFNLDGHQDVLVGARGGNLYFLAGDGNGGLSAPQMLPIAGLVRGLAANIDGHVAVSFDGSNGSELEIFAPGLAGLKASATYPLPARGESVAWGTLGGGVDVAVGAGSNVAIVYGALTNNWQAERVTLPYQVKGLALGDYVSDKDYRTEIAVLADDGSIHILQHGTLNTAPPTAAERAARRAASLAAAKGKKVMPPAFNPTALGAWTEARKLTYSGSAPASALSVSAFSTPHLAASTTHDLMVVDAGKSQINILDTSGKTASPSARISFSGTPIAALALPQKIDASRDIVVLTSSQAAPMIATAGSDPAVTVNTTADVDMQGACTNSSVTVGSLSGTISLRTATCAVNNSGPGTYTINVPSDTYQLTSFDTGELFLGNKNTGMNISIVGAGSSTIIQQTDGKHRVMEQDPNALGGIHVSLSNLTLMGGDCTYDDGTQFGPNDCSLGGGAFLGDGPNDNTTITGVTMSSNQANPLGSQSGGGQDFGGAVAHYGPNLSIMSSTFSGNSASGDGGGVFYNCCGNGAGSFSISNSSFTGNTLKVAGGGGGGFEMQVTTAGFGASSISGSTFTGNTATADGGGMAFAQIDDNVTAGAITVSNSRIVGNMAQSAGGTGIYNEFLPGNYNNNWWGCNGGPGASGCDTFLNDQGSVTLSNWLVLSISANPNQILPSSGTSTLTADLTHNNGGTGGFAVSDGTPVSFGGSLGSDNPTSTTTMSGQAISTYTAGSTAGSGTGTATVDNQEVSTPIEILASVTVGTSPAGLSFTVDNVSYTSTQTFNWVVGSSHTIATTSPQNVSGGTEQVFSSWSDSGAISHSVTAPSSSTTYTANFNTEYQLTTVASPSADGSVTPTSGGYYASGASVAVTATANSGFAFNNWTSTGGGFDSTTAASTNFTMPAAAATVTGNFVPLTKQITITTTPANLLVSVDGGPSSAAPLVETWNQDSTHTIATTSPQSGGTGIQYAFSSWSDSGAISHTITVPSTATTYTANFVTQYQLTTAANPGAGGTVSPGSGNYYTPGTNVPLTATANAGYSFTNWTGNVANPSSASTSIAMTAPQSVTANFSLTIVAASTTTSVSSNNNPSFTTPPGNSVTFTATVTSNTTVNEGTVTFSDTANDFTCSGGNTVPVSNGQAACTTSFTTEGARNVTGTYNGTVNFETSNGFIAQTVNNHTVITGNQFCNQGAITIPSTAGAATPYPSNIFVTGLSGNIGAVTVNLNNITSSDIQQTDLLLVGPTGAQIIPFASVGDSSSVGGVNITLDDTASSLIPGDSPLTTGTYKPTSITGSTSLVFPAPAPLVNASNYAATDGAATLTSTFQNTAPNGTWALYAMDNSGNGAASIGGGWCVNISPATVQTTITTSPGGLLVSVDGGTATAAPLVESWVPGSTHTIATTPPQSGGTGVQYVFSSWSDGGAISHSIMVPSTATTYTASFNTLYLLTTAANPSNGGTVSPTSGAYSYYPATTVVSLTATANAGYSFTNWTGNVANSSSASTTVTMNSPQSVAANFAAAQVTVSPTSVNFGEAWIGFGAHYDLTVTNHGSTNVVIGSITFINVTGNPGDFSSHNYCPNPLKPGKTCLINAKFMPSSETTETATMNIQTNAPGSPLQVSLKGTGK